MPKETPSGSREMRTSPADNFQISRKPTNTGAAGTKTRKPIVLNTQEIEKSLKTINVFKKNLKDSEKKPGPTEVKGPGQLNQRPQNTEIWNNANNFTLNPFKQVLQEQPESNQTSARTNRSETNNSTASQVSNTIHTSNQEKWDRSNQQNFAPEYDPRSTKNHLEIEKKQLLNKLETAELQSSELRQDNEMMQADLIQREQEIRRLNELLEAAKKQINSLSSSKQGAKNVDSDTNNLKQTIEELNSYNADLVRENKDLNSRIDELNTALYNSGKENAKKLRDLQTELERQKDASEEAQNELTILREQKNALAERCDKLEYDLRNFKASYQALSQENALNLEKYNELKEQRGQEEVSQQTLRGSDAQGEVSNLEKEIERLKGELVLNQQQLETIRGRGNELAKRAMEMQTRLTAEKQEMEQKLKAANDEQKENTINSEKVISDLKKQLKEAETRKEEALFKQTELSIQLQSLKITNEKIQAELESKKGTLQDTSKDYETILNDLKKENTQLRAKCNALDAKLKETEEKLHTNEEYHKKEFLALKDKYHQLEADNEKMPGENQGKSNETSLELVRQKEQLLALKRENEKQLVILQQANEQKDSRVSSLERENQELLQRVAQLQKDLIAEAKSRDETAELAAKLAALEQLLKTSHAAEENYKKELLRLSDKCNQLKSENESLQEERKKKNNITFQEPNGHKEHTFAMDKEHKMQLLVLQENEQNESKIKELEKQNQELIQKLAQLQKDITPESKSREERAELVAKVTALEQLLKTSHVAEENYKKELSRLNDTCHQLEGEIEKLQGENKSKNNDASMELAQYQEQILALKKDNEKQLLILQHTIEQRDSKLKDLEKDNQDLIQKVAQLQKDLTAESKNRDEKADLVAKVSGFEQLLKTSQVIHDTTIGSLQEEIKRLKAELEAAKQQVVQYSEDEIASIEFENDKLKRQIKDLNTKIANEKLNSDSLLVKENLQLKAKITSIQKEHQQNEDEIQQLNITLQKMKAEHKDLKAKESTEAVKVQNELIKSKQKLGDVMNLVLELGSEDLQEKVFSTINTN